MPSISAVSANSSSPGYNVASLPRAPTPTTHLMPVVSTSGGLQESLAESGNRPLHASGGRLWQSLWVPVDPSPQARFAHLHIGQWRQFREVDVSFHERLTVLTGANASGKTTLLNILGRHFNIWQQLYGVPVPTKPGQFEWRSDNRLLGDAVRGVGTLTYSENDATFEAAVTVPATGLQYDVGLSPQRHVPGIYIPSHRPAGAYQALANIPLQFSPGSYILQQYLNELRNRYVGGTSPKGPMLLMKEALICAAIFGEGNSAIQADPEAYEIWIEFQEKLRQLLPASLGFIELAVRRPDIVIRTETADFILESMSGGVGAIVEP
jgi:hypothetical protein